MKLWCYGLFLGWDSDADLSKQTEEKEYAEVFFMEDRILAFPLSPVGDNPTCDWYPIVDGVVYADGKQWSNLAVQDYQQERFQQLTVSSQPTVDVLSAHWCYGAAYIADSYGNHRAIPNWFKVTAYEGVAQ